MPDSIQFVALTSSGYNPGSDTFFKAYTAGDDNVVLNASDWYAGFSGDAQLYTPPGGPTDPAPVPEPSTFFLLGGVLTGLALVVRRRRKE